jgi:hypothetical protein
MKTLLSLMALVSACGLLTGCKTPEERLVGQMERAEVEMAKMEARLAKMEKRMDERLRQQP